MKKTIQMTETGVVITPYYKNQNYYFEKLTSTYDTVRHKRNPVTGLILENGDKPDCFVTHLHNPTFLQAQFPGYILEEIPKTFAKKLSVPVSMNPDITPKEAQYEIIQEIMAHDKKSQWFVYLSQGLGKTLLTVYLMTYFNKKTLIMCYNKDILFQWRDTMKEKTNIDPRKILYMDSSKLLNTIATGDFPVWEYDVFMCTPGLLSSFGKKYGYYLINALMEKMGIGFKVFDEAHRNISNIIKINAFTSIERTIYLSGDFGQSDRRKEQLYFNMFHGIPILQPSEELMNTLKFTVAIVVRYNTKPTELDKASVYSKRGFSFYEYMKYQFRKPLFFETLDFVISTIKKTNTKHYKILILVNMIDHVDQLTEKIKEKYSDAYTIGSYHSNIPESEREFCKDHCDIIISTYQSFSTGIDVSCIKYVISCSICTKIDDNQASGRARPLPDGSDAYYFMLADYGFPYTKKKLGLRLEYLKQTKIKNIESIKYE